MGRLSQLTPSNLHIRVELPWVGGPVKLDENQVTVTAPCLQWNVVPFQLCLDARQQSPPPKVETEALPGSGTTSDVFGEAFPQNILAVSGPRWWSARFYKSSAGSQPASGPIATRQRALNTGEAPYDERIRGEKTSTAPPLNAIHSLINLTI